MHRYLETARQLLVRSAAAAAAVFAWIRPRVIDILWVMARLCRRGIAALRARWRRWSPVLRERGLVYARLSRMHKPIGIFLLLWPTLWALWIAASGWPDTPVLLVFVCGVFLMRSAGCVANDLADRKFDRYVERTRERPLVTGEISVREARLLLASYVLIAFLLVLTTNRLTVLLSLVAVCLALVYPFMKRFTYLPQFVLGLAFGWSIPMAFAAQTGAVPAIAWLLLLGNILWSVSYDTMYAMVDREDDLRIGVKSTAILFDDADRLIIGIIQLMLMLVLVLLGDRLHLGIYYYVGLLLAAIMAGYQQFLIRDRTPELCFKAFLNNNWLGAVIFIGLFLNFQLQ